MLNETLHWVVCELHRALQAHEVYDRLLYLLPNVLSSTTAQTWLAHALTPVFHLWRPDPGYCASQGGSCLLLRLLQSWVSGQQ